MSFEPPPREELTIIEPSISATRLSPPGTIEIVSPKTANGRRSTWRGASTPSSPAVGTVDRRDDLLRDPLVRRAADDVGQAGELDRVGVGGPMNTPLPPDRRSA